MMDLLDKRRHVAITDKRVFFYLSFACTRSPIVINPRGKFNTSWLLVFSMPADLRCQRVSRRLTRKDARRERRAWGMRSCLIFWKRTRVSRGAIYLHNYLFGKSWNNHKKKKNSLSCPVIYRNSRSESRVR